MRAEFNKRMLNKPVNLPYVKESEEEKRAIAARHELLVRQNHEEAKACEATYRPLLAALKEACKDKADHSRRYRGALRDRPGIDTDPEELNFG